MLYRSPGYALSLLAESTTGVLHCAEAVSSPGASPEDLALQAAQALLIEVQSRGCVDRQHQCLVLLMMILGSEDVGRCRLGEPTTRTSVDFDLRHTTESLMSRVGFSFCVTQKTFSGHHSRFPPQSPRTYPQKSCCFLVWAQATSTPTVHWRRVCPDLIVYIVLLVTSMQQSQTIIDIR
jgi:hypothetical protein